MERAIRREREKAAIYGTIGKQGGDKEVKKLSARHRRRAAQMRKEYETFSKEHELAYYPERTSAVKGENIYARTVGNTDGALTKSAESGIINIRSCNGITILGISQHMTERAQERMVDYESIRDALINPLNISNIRIDSNGRKSQRFIGKKCTVNINPETGVITTVWITGSKMLKKYDKGNNDV